MTLPRSLRLTPKKRPGMRRVAATLPYLAALAIWLCAAATTAQPQAGGHWQVVIAAGDNEEPVFDNGVAAMARFLTRHGVPPADIHRLSAAETGAEPATLANLTHRIATLPVGSGDRCLVFVTSHGVHGEGVYLARDDKVLSPKALAAALSRGCASVPTVVIVSACYSGNFAAPPMTAPNRVVLTASRADRPSFGCQADRTFTVFDECLLAALPKIANWHGAFRDTAACVKRRERAWRVLPSYPQVSFGAATRQISLWF